jgi:hypothetical protein
MLFAVKQGFVHSSYVRVSRTCVVNIERKRQRSIIMRIDMNKREC